MNDETMKLTWVVATRIHLECVKHGENEQTKLNADQEIMRMAEGYDKLIKSHTELVEKFNELARK